MKPFRFKLEPVDSDFVRMSLGRVDADPQRLHFLIGNAVEEGYLSQSEGDRLAMQLDDALEGGHAGMDRKQLDSIASRLSQVYSGHEVPTLTEKQPAIATMSLAAKKSVNEPRQMSQEEQNKMVGFMLRHVP